ncbi:TadE/TadG family type IV pilus assembly protein [Notoacmeibacter sp. MSK16QG-6]|uniref:TadE/TadG family type IV pilus assembly protein n=1 Tax=Notoacmeibacter sp. MSK16QG-6 TaxID=2957982 RepID=UPI0020A0FF3F|nr:TadE/TadG family type IV pilus assembly protein [Notoacmeibacter sp. MSK16QG-6]MCP1198773.1 pilus assembly protein [Notoacmeibacter sp. MSK16QG-6]
MLHSVASRSRSAAQRLWQDRRGVAATEFAIVAPFLLVAYLGSIELAAGIDAAKKISRSAGVVADLVTQGDSYTSSELGELLDIGMANIQPYSRSKPTMSLYGIEMDDSSGTVQAKVKWSITKTKGGSLSQAVAAGTVLTDVPANLLVKDTFLVRAVTDLSYKSLSLGSTEYTGNLDGIALSDTANFRPRYEDEITCSDCGSLP